MIDFNLYVAFILTVIFVISTPGPAVLFVIARSVNLGVRGGIYSMLGLACGALVYAVAVAFGLAQLLESSPQAFLFIKNLGCLYLIYLGLKTILSKENYENTEEEKIVSAKNLIKEGFLVELFNPKTALFFLAFLPQFTNFSLGNMEVQLIILGLTFVIVGLVTDSFYVLSAGHIGKFLKQSITFKKIEKYFSGSIYCSLGIAGLFHKIQKSQV
ncbi:LysE family translocator [Sulfurospirillum arcachonense]|uniref:LysE family translocator n=1 Tax=Sulfurospirillum arcachonense TaxID=57666 RepID=UPI0004690E63|nr:LysE family translocator [Sulfurospirillum arcachonense]